MLELALVVFFPSIPVHLLHVSLENHLIRNLLRGPTGVCTPRLLCLLGKRVWFSLAVLTVVMDFAQIIVLTYPLGFLCVQFCFLQRSF